MVPKMTKFFGDVLPIPIIHGTTRGRSADFPTALGHKGQSSSVVFQLTRVSDYGLASISRETMLASEDDKGAFLRASKVNIDGALLSLSRSMAFSLFRDSSGALGQAGTISTTTLTLSSIHDITSFEVGDEVVAAAAKSTGSLRAGSATITAIDRDLGTMESDSNWTAQITWVQIF